ncbi:MAG: hypothetical protein CMH63_00045 [Nanoarchaeota archaeon]|nr:hypothetical protein [Nanoarchaeota archaeon]
MISLQSLHQTLSQIGKPCTSCEELNWRGVYGSTRKGKNETLIYQCSLGIGAHDLEVQLDFEASLERLEKTIGVLLSATAPPAQKKPRLTKRRLETTLKLLPPELELEMEGYCFYCLEPATLSIRNQRLEYICTCPRFYDDEYDIPQID